MSFEELQPDAVSAQVLKYAKGVYQMEKGLPPNGVVPALKAKVEEMREKVWCGDIYLAWDCHLLLL